MDEILNQLTTTECLVTLIRSLNTPIARRKNSEDINYCVTRIYNELEEKGVLESPKADLSWLLNL